MPVLFLGHGSPMNVIEDNEYRRAWQALGQQFSGAQARWPRPQLILCISAHWLTQGWWLTAMPNPPTIHDFGGFPQELFEQQYPAPGAPEAAARISRLLQPPPGEQAIGLDDQAWGLDHGCWGVLKPMFPEADIPVIQLSMDYAQGMAAHYALGRQLSVLREHGVLIVASGNIVHNLRTMQRHAGNDQAFDWVIEFDQTMARHMAAGELEQLQHFRALGRIAELAHPSWEHFLPLLYAAGAARPDEPVEFFNEGYQAGSIAMRSVIWG